MNLSSLDVTGYQGQPVLNTFIAHPEPARHLGIVLPGYRYPADMPPLHYAGRVLLDQGADLLRVEYAYYRTSFQQQPESTQDEWIASDVFAACEAGLSQRSYEEVTLIGKSLGTIAMGHLLSDRRFQNATCIWLTPILTLEWLCSRIEQLRPRSLFVIGTADPFYRPDVLRQLQQATHGQVAVLEGVDHSLEISGDIHQSLLALHQMVEQFQSFLGKATS